MSEDRLISIIMWSICVALVIAVIAWAVVDCSAQSKCRDDGGRVDEYDCRTVVTCHHSGKTTTCYPTRTCNWRCVGLPAERAP